MVVQVYRQRYWRTVRRTYYRTHRQRYWKVRRDGVRQRYWRKVTRKYTKKHRQRYWKKVRREIKPRFRIYEYTLFSPYEHEFRTTLEIEKGDDPYSDENWRKARMRIRKALDHLSKGGFSSSGFQETIEIPETFTEGVRKVKTHQDMVDIFRRKWSMRVNVRTGRFERG